MTERIAYLDRSVGETRGVITVDGRPERLILARSSDRPVDRVGARFAGRVRKVEPAFASAFVELGGGAEGILPYKPEARPIEGQMVEVEVRSPPRSGKLAILRAIGDASGIPRNLTRAPDVADQLGLYCKDGRLVEGSAARSVCNEAEAEVLETLHPLPGGGTLAIEPTRALVAIDVDLGDRKGQDSKRVSRQANLAAISEAARLLRLKGLGGIVVIDLVGRGHDGAAMLAAARTAFGPDNPGVAIGPVGRFGTMEISVPRRDRSNLELLCRGGGVLSEETLALRLSRLVETEANASPGARIRASAHPSIIALFEPFASLLRERFGERIDVASEAGWMRERLEARAQ